MVVPDAAPAGVLRKHALGRHRGSARRPFGLPQSWLTAAIPARQLGCHKGKPGGDAKSGRTTAKRGPAP